ncbi:odorant receptor 10-like [Prorops nasuta]|uniref:odorant receptor 10-like n=1 Tax=Prorops nasuta TaxID=863751 RepID=UPI0034CECFAF
MHMFPLSFFVMSAIGVWRPASWTSGPKVVLCGTYSFFVLTTIWSFCLAQFIHIIQNLNDFEEVAKTIHVSLLSIGLLAFKGTVWVLRHGEIIRLSERFFLSPMKPENSQEETVQLKFYKITRFLSIVFIIPVLSLILERIVQTTLLLNEDAFRPSHEKIQENEQLNEDQIKIQEKKQIIICVKHHIHIFKYAKELNEIFSPILFGHAFVHILLLCSIIYHLSIGQEDVSVASNFLYLSIVSTQVFLYCWFGNEVIISSSDFSSAIYSMDWRKLTLRGQKDLLIILLRTRTPIKFTSSFLVTLSNDSFVTIIKASYSIFNLMRHTNT